MDWKKAKSVRAEQALELVEGLQQRLAGTLQRLGNEPLLPSEWLRDEGRHGGGRRFGIAGTNLLDSASVNVSQVHYGDEPERKLASATAISSIVHPAHPLLPSIHLHFSWTEQKGKAGYWRMMADLNPSNPDPAATKRFSDELEQILGDRAVEARTQGERYFFIPALKRHRGVVHYYLENFNTGRFEEDLQLAAKMGKAAIDTYAAILQDALHTILEPTQEERDRQLAYHTLYLFQVLTLDRGTTMGLLVHDQNDLGIMGSLPPRIDRRLLASWIDRLSAPQDKLLIGLLAALPQGPVCVIDDATKLKLAEAIRAHYRAHPEGLEYQASGNSVPPTLENHR